MNILYTLTQEEYEELLQQKNEPDNILRDTNENLLKKITELNKTIEKGSFANIKVDAPIVIHEEVMSLRAIPDFIQMYNFLSNHYNGVSLTKADLLIYNYLSEFCNMYACELYFKSVSDVKKYRVSLQKKGLCSNSKKDGVIQLTGGN